MKTKELHHTEVVVRGKEQTKYLVPKRDYKANEMKPDKKREVGERELQSRNNKHPYIFRGRRM